MGQRKMGLVGLMHVLAVEGAKYDIKCNAIAPTARTRMTEELLGPIAEFLDPETVTPLVIYLCSPDCEQTHEIYSVGGGRFARLFVGLAPGWIAGKGKVVSAEAVRDQIDQIRDPQGYIIPRGIGDEMKAIANAPEVTPGSGRSDGIRHTMRGAPSLLDSDSFDQCCVRESAPFAHRLYAQGPVDTLEFVQEGGHQLSAGATQGMAQCDRPTVCVELFVVSAQGLGPGHRDGGEGLVYFVAVHVADGDIGSVEKSLGGGNGGPQHDHRVVAGQGHGADSSPGFRAESSQALLVDDEHGGRPVGDLTRSAGGQKPGVGESLEGLHGFHAGVVANPFVLVKTFRRAVFQGNFEWHDLSIETTFFGRPRPLGGDFRGRKRRVFRGRDRTSGREVQPPRTD